VVNFLWQPSAPKFGGVVGQRILGGWEVGGVISRSTGSPFTVGITGDPLGQNSTDAKAFASRIYGPGCNGNPVNSGSVTNYLKLQCFTVPLVPDSFAGVCQPGLHQDSNGTLTAVNGTCMNLFGNAGRNTVVGPGLFNVDFSMVKNNRIETISETFNIQFRAEFFNLLNHANFQSPLDNRYVFDQTGLPVQGAGAIDSTTTPSRQIQLGLKVIW
jgi:hypothetical protein